MFDVSVNWWLVAGLAIGAWILGFLWFVMIFGKAYMAGHGRTKAQLDNGPSMPMASFYQFIGTFLQVVVLAWLVELSSASTMQEGALLGVLIWLGFIAAYIAPMYAFQAYSRKYLAIVIGYPLVVLIVAGAVLAGA
jgi:hypothetical protein